MTFSKPLFNGVQWDFLSDKYALTLLASRTDNPALSATATNRGQGATVRTIFTNLIGLRGTAQIGDFIKLGTTYVNAGHWNSSESFGNNSLKGTLGGNLQAGNVQRLLVRLSDDSPEDGEGGALLFLHRVYINGVEHPEISDRALVDGGIRRQGTLGGQWRQQHHHYLRHRARLHAHSRRRRDHRLQGNQKDRDRIGPSQ